MARIAGVNIPTNKIVQTGLTYIYGIGDKFSKKICSFFLSTPLFSLSTRGNANHPVITFLFCVGNLKKLE